MVRNFKFYDEKQSGYVIREMFIYSSLLLLLAKLKRSKLLSAAGLFQKMRRKRDITGFYELERKSYSKLNLIASSRILSKATL